MSDKVINSKEYWDNRFEQDWNDYDGSKQTEFFAKLACEMFPEWLERKIRLQQYSVCDMGCALGDGVDVLAKHLGVEVVGLDFSESAIKIAKEKYPQYAFYVADITKDQPSDRKYDVVFCSNVLEHFYNPWTIFKNLTNLSSHIIIVLVPFMETIVIDEHQYHFDVDHIPLEIDEFNLVYVDVKNGKDIENTFYPDKQIMLIYSRDVDEHRLTNIGDLLHGFIELAKAEHKKALSDREKFYEDQINELNIQIEQLNVQILQEKEVAANLEESNRKLSESEQRIEELNRELSVLLEKKNELATKFEQYKNAFSLYEEAKKELEESNKKLSDMEKQIVELNVQLTDTLEQRDGINTKYRRYKDAYTSLLEAKKDLEELSRKLFESDKQIEELNQQLDHNQRIIQQALSLCYDMTNSRLFKMLHFMNRFKYQGMKGDKQEKVKFRRWFFSKLKGGVGDSDRRYNPIFGIINILNDNSGFTATYPTECPQNNTKNMVSIYSPDHLNSLQKKILSSPYKQFDVIILAVIDYDFRYQRPQHFATSFAANGHRVFYINANFHRGSGVDAISDNLNVVRFTNNATTAIYETDWSDNMYAMKEQVDQLLYQYGIRDAITIVDYPNWINTAQYLRERYGFKIITDYMDDFTGFLNPAEKLVQANCIRLLQESDYVVPSSQFLYDIAKKYNNNLSIVRNGTEFAHFHKATMLKKSKSKKVIGYYGAVSHWFDFDKIYYLAEQLPDYEIVIIGEVTVNSTKFNKYSNVKLLGEMPYADLPEHLAYFDVCLIPFDTSTDLIKATNPVKFYEYLSAGKKIVATEIPELMPFRDKYVYMSNDNEQFCNYVKLCLEGKDTLESYDNCIDFGKENDWQARYKAFAEICRNAVPKVSIIVLTYNNLKLNQICINSILEQTAYPRYELIIVDNMSSDGTIEYLKELDNKKLPNVKIILNDQNSGFAGGNNLGIKASDGDYVVTLNNDTIVTRGWLTSLTKVLENDKSIGMSGPVTNSIGNEAKIKVDYKDMESLNYFAYLYTWINMDKQFRDPDVLALFCTMIRREVINQCGLLDERYKVGMFEDDDYAEAVKHAGYRLTIAEDAFIHHFDGATFKKLEDSNYKKIFDENKEKFEKKWNRKWKMQKYRLGVDWDTNLDIKLN